MKITGFFPVLPLCLCLLSGIGCTSAQKSAENTLVTVRFDQIKETRTIPLSSLVEDYRLVRFENSDSAYFKRWVVHATDRYIGIRQYGGPFKLFDRDGKFLCDVGAIGQGPGEYTALYDEQIDEANGKIYLMGFAQVRNLFEYDLKGRFIRAIPLTYDLKKPKFRLLPDGTFGVIQIPMRFAKDKAMAVHYASDGRVLNELPPRDDMWELSFDSEIFSYKNTDAFDFQLMSVDTLYHYDAREMSFNPVFTMQFPDPEKKPFHVYLEMPGYYFTMMFDSGLIATDKKDGTSFYAKIVDDFCGHLEVPQLSFNNGWLACSVNPMDLQEKIEARLSEDDCTERDREQLEALVKTLHENDNDLLFIGKLK